MPIYSALIYSDNPRRLLAEAIMRNDGIVKKVAWEIGMRRHRVYDAITKYELWPMVKEVQRRARERRQREKDLTVAKI